MHLTVQSVSVITDPQGFRKRYVITEVRYVRGQYSRGRLSVVTIIMMLVIIMYCNNNNNNNNFNGKYWLYFAQNCPDHPEIVITEGQLYIPSRCVAVWR
jgi:hypothetical protein